MSHISIILTGLMTMAMAVFFAPGILAMNHGNILRNIALWLAIFLGLALFYKNFGPESSRPLFHMPLSMVGMRGTSAQLNPPDATEVKDGPKGGLQVVTPPTR